MIHKQRWGIALTTFTIATLLITQKLQPAGRRDRHHRQAHVPPGRNMAITGTGFLSSLDIRSHGPEA